MTTSRPDEYLVAAALLTNDPKYRKYTQQIDKALSTFENVHDWADCTAFLTRLLKTFQAFTQYSEIPSKLVVAKRLSQCLNPALPTGVHQRALDVYSHILTASGIEVLKRDLQLWASGLLPFFEYASTSLKNTVLDLYQMHFLRRELNVRSLTRAFLIALVPGLEEEGTEHYDRVFNVLTQLETIVTPVLFFQNLWLVIMTVPSVRSYSLGLISRKLPKVKSDDEITGFAGRDLGLMIRALSASLEDENVLAQRAVLDVLIQSMPMDGQGIKRAQLDDRLMLMTSALRIVLRRDLSLNRRLHRWLLGASEQSDHQMSFFKLHSLDLLSSSLTSQMTPGPLNLYDPRPWKIFFALLDKWEIGGPLTETLIFSTVKILPCMLSNDATNEQPAFRAAVNLYEAIQPWALWMSIFAKIYGTFPDHAHQETLHSCIFLLNHLSIWESESRNVHIPVVYAAIAEHIEVKQLSLPTWAEFLTILPQCTIASRRQTTLTYLNTAVELLAALLKHIPLEKIQQSAEVLTDKVTQSSDSCLTQACLLYNVAIQPSVLQQQFDTYPTLFALSVRMSLQLLRFLDGGSQAVCCRAYSNVIQLCLTLVEANSSASASQATDRALAEELQMFLLQDIPRMPFESKLLSVRLSVRIQETRMSSLPNFRNDRDVRRVTQSSKLLGCLKKEFTPHHSSIVDCLWSLQAFAGNNFLESSLAQMVAVSDDIPKTQEAYTVFGAVWRYSSDQSSRAVGLRVPLFCVLNILSSAEMSLRELAIDWLRSCPSSHITMIDLLLSDLVDSQGSGNPLHANYTAKLTANLSENPWRVSHLLQLLLAVIRVGGGPLVQSLSDPSLRPGLSQLVAGISNIVNDAKDDSLLELLLKLLSLIVDINMTKDPSSQAALAVHTNTISVLHFLAANCDMTPKASRHLQSGSIRWLSFEIHKTRLVVQPPLLRLLDCLMNPTSGYRRHTRAADTVTTNLKQSIQVEHRPPVDLPIFWDEKGRSVTALIVEGVKAAFGKFHFRDWLEFVSAVSVLHDAFDLDAYLTITECLSGLISSTASDVDEFWTSGNVNQWPRISDDELVLLISVLERTVLTGIPDQARRQDPLIDSLVDSVSRQQDSGRLLNLVAHVFTTESHLDGVSGGETLRSASSEILKGAISSLYAMWHATASRATEKHTFPDSINIFASKTWTRCRRALERLFRNSPSEVFAILVQQWDVDRLLPKFNKNSVFVMVDLLASNTQEIIDIACDNIRNRIFLNNGKPASYLRRDQLHIALFDFLEQYLTRLENSLSVLAFGSCQFLAKEVNANWTANQEYLSPIIRCLLIIGDKLVLSSAMDDKRLRRDFQEVFLKLLDVCILASGGKSDSKATWRLRTGEMDFSGGGSVPSSRPETPKRLVDESEPATQTISLGDQINSTLSEKTVPVLPRLLNDPDKMNAVCASCMQHIIAPAMRSKAGLSGGGSSALTLLQAIAKVPGTARAWRSFANEVFLDSKFFSMPPEEGDRWRAINQALHLSDKQAFSDILSRVSTAASTGLFTNREAEITLRRANLRRLSYAIYAGSKDHYLDHLPAIQEKLVELLKNGLTLLINADVYLCMRILLCRISPYNMPAIWPVILSDLMAIFRERLFSSTKDDPDEIHLVLSACKFLDLAVTMETQEFVLHQWMFITDTVDAIYPPDEWTPNSLLDELSGIITNVVLAPPHPNLPNGNASAGRLRRPMLAGLSSISSISELGPFFSQVSLSSYESLYASVGRIDYEAVEQDLLNDVFTSC